MLTIVIFPILFVSLFILYVLCKYDFLLIRKDIKMPFLFNNIFLSIGIGMIVARLIYIVDSNKIFLINPLVFFHLVNYGGLSIFGEFLVCFFLHQKKKRPEEYLIYHLCHFFLYFFYIFFQNLFPIFLCRSNS